MRVIECNICGQVLQAADDDELLRVTTSHFQSEHADMDMGEEQLRGLVEREAYTATDA